MRPLLEWLDQDGFYVDTVWDIERGEWGEAGPIQLLPHQRRIFAHCFTPDEHGKFPYTTIVYSAPKKSGKSKIAAMVAAWYAECSRPNTEIDMVANDRDQAQRLTFNDLVYHAEHHLGIRATAYRITYPDGTYVQALANQYSSAAGGRMGLTVWDELWAYSCLEAGTLVLTAELRWKPIEDVVVGEALIGFDDQRVGQYRSFRKTIVTDVSRCRAPARRFHLSNGRELTCSLDHKLLARKGKRHSNEWQLASELSVGDHLNQVSDIWADDRSYLAGYLAAAFDGEGSLVQNGREGWRLDFAQRDNPMREQVKAFLNTAGFQWWDAKRKTRGCKNLGMAEKHQVMKFLGMYRPARLLEKVDPDKLGRMTSLNIPEIVAIDEIQEEWPLVSVTTTTGTLIANGYAVHNSEHSRRMWSEMAVPPTVPNAMRFIATYAGFENESDQLLELYNMCFKRENGELVNGEVVPELADIVDSKGEPVCRRNRDTFVYWDTEPRMPWQTVEYYESQMMTIRPSDFLRMHRNAWVSSSESFIPIELWDRATRHQEGPATLFKTDVRRTYPVSVGVDIGMKHDCSALVGVYWDGTKRRAGIAFHRIWTPPPDAMLDLEFTVEEELLRLNHEFKIVSIVYDPAQFQRSAVTLLRKSLPIVEFPNTPGNMMLATQALFDLLKNNLLDAYPDPELRDHLRYASAETTARGFRLIKGKHVKFKIDAAVALAMAAYDAVNRGGVDTSIPVQIISPFSDATAVRIPTIMDEFNMKLPEALRD